MAKEKNLTYRVNDKDYEKQRQAAHVAGYSYTRHDEEFPNWNKWANDVLNKAADDIAKKNKRMFSHLDSIQ